MSMLAALDFDDADAKLHTPGMGTFTALFSSLGGITPYGLPALP